MYQNQVKLALLALVFSLSQILAQDDFSDESATQTNNKFSITGIVIDASNGKAVAGANVIVDGTDLGAAADEEGKFMIEGVDAGSAITASAIGYDDLKLYADQE